MLLRHVVGAGRWVRNDAHALSPRKLLFPLWHILLGSLDMVPFIFTTAAVLLLVIVVFYVVGYVWIAGYYILQGAAIMIRTLIYAIAPFPNDVYYFAAWIDSWHPFGANINMTGWGLWGTAMPQYPLPCAYGTAVCEFSEYLVNPCTGYDTATAVLVGAARVVAMPLLCQPFVYLNGNAFFGRYLLPITTAFLPESVPGPAPCGPDALDVFCVQLGIGFLLVRVPMLLTVLWIFFGLIINGVLPYSVLFAVHCVGLPFGIARLVYHMAMHVECAMAVQMSLYAFAFSEKAPPSALPSRRFVEYSSADWQQAARPENPWDPPPPPPQSTSRPE